MNLREDRRMGKGLEALLNKPAYSKSEQGNNIVDIRIDQIDTNPYQPRKTFDLDKIDKLAASITSQGLIQPIVLREAGDRYQIISGERRFRAFDSLGRNIIPAQIFKGISDSDMLQIALIENIQREQLNPIEIASSYQQLIDECNLTQEELSERLGKKRSSIANYLRFNKLPTAIKQSLADGIISMGHAKILAGLRDDEKIMKIFQKIISDNLSVKELEKFLKRSDNEKLESVKKNISSIDPIYISQQEKSLSEMIQGHNVRIKVSDKNTGNISIPFKSETELKNIISILNSKR